ncbi:MAG: transcriptional regulator [Acidobacteriia bacterium]|nr:transcriptional regulator [Terriglobia bacterium]
MVARSFDLMRYAHLLSEAHPTLPHTEKENQRLIAIAGGLTEKNGLSPEEAELLEMLLALIQKFEDRHYATKRAAPHKALLEMMRAHNLRPKDLYQVFGSKGTTSEVLRGKRSISKAAAKALAARLNVSTDLFL